MQGAKHSDTWRYREHLQRSNAPGFACTATADFSDSVDWVRAGELSQAIALARLRLIAMVGQRLAMPFNSAQPVQMIWMPRHSSTNAINRVITKVPTSPSRAISADACR